MARRSLLGQLSMFDLLHNAEGDAGEVQMVSLMADYEDVVDAPKETVEIQAEETEIEKAELEKFESEKSKSEKTESEKAVLEKNESEKVELEKTEQKKVSLEKTESERAGIEETEIEEAEIKEVPVQETVHTDMRLFAEEKPVMSRSWMTENGICEIAYLNYNKVRLIRAGQEPQIKEFESSKDAVDFYISQIQGIGDKQ